MAGEASWTERAAWLHLAVLVGGTVLYLTWLLEPFGAELQVPDGALLVGFPIMFGLSMTLGLLTGRARVRARVNGSLGTTLVALSGLMLCVSAAFSAFYFSVATGDWWEGL